MTLIGGRCKVSDGLSRAVLIARQLLSRGDSCVAGRMSGITWGVVPVSFLVSLVNNRISGGYSSGAPPLPIPNREVKPTRADGTALRRGRVGRRRFYREASI